MVLEMHEGCLADGMSALGHTAARQASRVTHYGKLKAATDLCNNVFSYCTTFAWQVNIEKLVIVSFPKSWLTGVVRNVFITYSKPTS